MVRLNGDVNMLNKIKMQLRTFLWHKDLLSALAQTSASLRRKIPDFFTVEKAVEAIHKDRLTIFYSKLISQGELCFDVGAYVGEYTEILSALGAKVVACEPQPRESKKLHALFKNHKNVIVVSNALGEKEEEADLFISEKTGLVSTLSSNYKASQELLGYEYTETAKVSVTTLDRLIKLYGKPRYCKIDVEGLEVQVLRGLSTPVAMLSFEFKKTRLGEAETCVEILNRLGHYKFNLMLGNSAKFLFRDWVTFSVLHSRITDTGYGLDDRFVWGDVFCKLTENKA